MTNWIPPGKTMGLIGGSAMAYQLVLTAKQMGFQVVVYCNDKTAPVVKAADWAIIGSYKNEEALTELAFRSDFLVYETEDLPPEVVEYLKKTVPVPQGEELLSIVQDRVLQKAYLETNSVNIAPYATIVRERDIKEAVTSIGYPCVLKTNRTDKQFNKHVFLYGEEDIEQASTLLQKGVCVLEALIPYERELEITVARNRDGQQISYPVSEMVFRGDNLHQVITPARISIEVEEEVKRIALYISRRLDVIGSLSLELLVTATGTLYVNTLIFGPHIAGGYTLNYSNLTHLEAHLKGILNWPLDTPMVHMDSVLVPFHKEHLEKITRQIPIKPNWTFYFYPDITKKIREREMGFVLIPSKEMEQTLETLSTIDLWEGAPLHD